MEAPEAEVAIRDAIRHWPRLTDLAEFAVQRHGYGNSDGGLGVTYPGDLDEYAREVDGIHLLQGFVQVHGFWGPPDGYDMLVIELAYLDVLAGVLLAAGHSADAVRVRALADKQRHAGPGAAS